MDEGKPEGQLAIKILGAISLIFVGLLLTGAFGNHLFYGGAAGLDVTGGALLIVYLRDRKKKAAKKAEDKARAVEEAARSAEEAARKEERRTGYRLLVTVGNQALKSLENCMLNMYGGSHSQEHTNQFVQFVNQAIRACTDWQGKARSEVEEWDGQVGKTLLTTYAARRPKPKYLGNAFDSQTWEYTAGYLDWLTEELNKP